MTEKQTCPVCGERFWNRGAHAEACTGQPVQADPCRVLEAIGRLQDEVANTWVQPLVDELVAALAADTTTVELRQEIEFLKAESGDQFARDNDGA